MKVIFDGIVGQNSNRITNIEKSFLAGKSILGGGGGGGCYFVKLSGLKFRNLVAEWNSISLLTATDLKTSPFHLRVFPRKPKYLRWRNWSRVRMDEWNDIFLRFFRFSGKS